MSCASIFRSILCAALGMVGAGSASATLFDRGAGLIYDDVLDITWLQDADLSGRLTWPDALSWAENFTYVDNVRGVIWTDWRLPKVSFISPDVSPHLCGDLDAAACASSGNELAYMFYVHLGGSPGSDRTGDRTTASGVVISDIGTSDYWSATACPDCGAWSVFFANGLQRNSAPGSSQTLTGFAWAVRDGDVSFTSPIPEPHTCALLLAGLGLFGLGQIRKARKP